VHHVANYSHAPSLVPPAYERHSQGYARIALVDHTIAGAMHTGLGLCTLAAQGTLNPHVHFYEEAFFVLEGQVFERIDGHDSQLGPGDYGIIPPGVPHSLRSAGDRPVRWLEMLSPQPKAPGQERDTLFFTKEIAPSTGTPPDFRDPMTRYLGHFDDAQMPPHSQLQMEGYRGNSIAGISLKMLVDHQLGAQQLTLFMVEFQPGGAGNIHDHPFEETYFLVSGAAEAVLDGKTYQVKAGDYVWTSVGGTHGFFNKGTVPVRWIETQTPQPPGQHGFRFPADWAYLAEKLDAQEHQ
jgi:mannose-6-phosphate isomerase-like protein (cupin superfamily)